MASSYHLVPNDFLIQFSWIIFFQRIFSLSNMMPHRYLTYRRRFRRPNPWLKFLGKSEHQVRQIDLLQFQPSSFQMTSVQDTIRSIACVPTSWLKQLLWSGTTWAWLRKLASAKSSDNAVRSYWSIQSGLYFRRIYKCLLNPISSVNKIKKGSLESLSLKKVHSCSFCVKTQWRIIFSELIL